MVASAACSHHYPGNVATHATVDTHQRPTQPQLVPLYEHSSTTSKHSMTPPPQNVSGMGASLLAKAREVKAEKMVDAWDKIGALTSEMAKSVMTKEAATVAKRYRTVEGNADSNDGPSSFKKARLDDSPSDEQQESGDSFNKASGENWSESLTRRVDRMARMSKLIMEIEYCHRQLRTEMVNIQKDLCPS